MRAFMFTASTRSLICALVTIAAGWSVEAFAHPVAQGAMDVEISDDSLRVQATVSAEEVLVAATGRSSNPSGDAWHDYGEYLRQHLYVRVDDETLRGTVLSVSQPAPRPTYVLEYPLQSRRAARIHIAQDTLHELEYAPGNNWEASYIVTAHRRGSPS